MADPIILPGDPKIAELWGPADGKKRREKFESMMRERLAGMTDSALLQLAKAEQEYQKWILEDPTINTAKLILEELTRRALI